ncbi:AcrR family transcriptional regulator [Kitasatospora sp. MAA4]|uniref:TetR/AcrR family transcriptional regulator n=1 Tax=Kitasatospora sp. MAA4 TaxID=3035093 RepID=UPI002476867A|nr:TetR/AcrR family transcriptional regulator [Kitasatospora sp. MAA4]MDH6134265.1 AcrR family transcriptional regulator [Kitasatospora sp. MAA4]
MADPKLSRRERLRAETAQEIKTIALAHMAENGTAAVSLRAIARDMGMTAGAIYSYYDTRDKLITALIADVYHSLTDTLEAALAACPGGPAARVLAYAQAYRWWAVANPHQFQLIFGDPVPEYQAPEGGPVAEAEHRACVLLTGLVVDAWPWAAHLHTGDQHDWADYDPVFARLICEAFPGLQPAAASLALRLWGRLHGLVSLEVHGHLGPQIQDSEKLYNCEIVDLIHNLGLAVPAELAPA